jgi:tetratricopeptide (TPR) repeat protein
MTGTLRVGILVGCVLCGCRSARVPAPGARGGSTARPSGPGVPRTRAELPTTSGDLALSNLSSQIDGLERIAALPPHDSSVQARLVPLLLLRGQLLGRIADYQRADELSRAVAEGNPGSVEARQLRASVDATLHRFADAEVGLRAAEKLGAQARQLEPARAAILEATGHGAAALPLRQRENATRPDLATRTALAVLSAELGDAATAARLFGEAQDAYHGASPFPLAFLYLQQGLVAERAGHLAQARDLFAAAIDRVPGFATAGSHLAGALAATGKRRQAMAVLEPLLKSSDDPELVGQMAALLRDDHRPEEAEALFVRGAERYEALLARLPEAFADHAARFYLSWGGHAGRALTLARANLALRPTRDAFALAIEAGLAAGKSDDACATADRLKATGALTPLQRAGVARAYQACGRRGEAQVWLAEQPTGRP